VYNRFVVKLQQTGCHLVVLAGNHDSVATLNESRDILAFLNTTVASAGRAADPAATRRHAGAILCPVPFYARATWSPARPGCPGKNSSICWRHHRLLSAAGIRCLRAARRSSLPIIATGHLTTVGASKSDAARHLYRHAGCLPAQNFPPADYIALGHIHRAQVVGGCEHIRYSGSPIALSFDETGKSKCVHLVSFEAGNSAPSKSGGAGHPAAGGAERRSGRHHRPAGAVARRAQDPPCGWISKSPPTTICMICSVKSRR
jgi:exonuclease SbcD